MVKQIVMASAIASSLFFSAGCSKQVESADLGKVLDVFVKSMDTFDASGHASSKKEASDEMMQDFTRYTEKNLNNPALMSHRVGLELKDDGMFEGFADKNSNSTRDSGEKTAFTVEIDTENNRLIATDMAGESTGARFGAAGGFIAGAILGNILARQRKSGIKSSSFSNRNVKSRTSSSSSSARSKSFSGSHSSGK